MKKELKFMRIVKWDEIDWGGEPMNTPNILKAMFICAIPIIGQIYFITCLIMSLTDRKVYYKQI